MVEEKGFSKKGEMPGADWEGMKRRLQSNPRDCTRIQLVSNRDKGGPPVVRRGRFASNRRDGGAGQEARHEAIVENLERLAAGQAGERDGEFAGDGG